MAHPYLEEHTPMLPGYLKKNDLTKILRELNEEAAFEQTEGDLYIYGGAALVLTDTHRTNTKDIDGFASGDLCGLLEQKARLLSARHNLDDYYYQDGTGEPIGLLELDHLDLSGFIQKGDLFDTLAYTASPTALRVHTLKPEPQLALKLLRWSPTSKDMKDMAHLCEDFGITSKNGLCTLWERYALLLPADKQAIVDDGHLAKTWMHIKFTDIGPRI